MQCRFSAASASIAAVISMRLLVVMRLAAPQLALVRAGDEPRAPAAGPGIALARAVRVDHDLAHAAFLEVGSARPPTTAGARCQTGRIGVSARTRLRALTRYAPASGGSRSGPRARASCVPSPGMLLRPRRREQVPLASSRPRSRAAAASRGCGRRSACGSPARGNGRRRETMWRTPQGPSGLKPQISTWPSPISTRSTSRSSSCGSRRVLERVRQQHRLDRARRDRQCVITRADRALAGRVGRDPAVVLRARRLTESRGLAPASDLHRLEAEHVGQRVRAGPCASTSSTVRPSGVASQSLDGVLDHRRKDSG